MGEAQRWQVIVLRDAKKMLTKAPADLRLRLLAALHRLEEDPWPEGCKKLVGSDLYRVRVGEWRITYAVEDDRLVVLVVEIAPRSGAYRSL